MRRIFSGDHILKHPRDRSPNGNMTHYLEPLDAADAACVQHGLACILPTHGHVPGHARTTIAGQRAHQLPRVAKVMRPMQAPPNGTLDDQVALACDDVPERI